jgi:hypothetical protein
LRWKNPLDELLVGVRVARRGDASRDLDANKLHLRPLQTAADDAVCALLRIERAPGIE